MEHDVEIRRVYRAASPEPLSLSVCGGIFQSTLGYKGIVVRRLPSTFRNNPVDNAAMSKPAGVGSGNETKLIEVMFRSTTALQSIDPGTVPHNELPPKKSL